MYSQHANPYYRCVTPPPLPKNKFPTSSHPDYTSLISSPVTPQSSHRSPVIHFLQDHERHILKALLSRADVHRPAEKLLFDQIHASGNSDYLNNRSVIVEWMSEVSTAFNFLPITLHLAVRHMDWTFAARLLPQRYFQLSAIAALFIAAKSEESGPNVPVLEDFRFICDNVFDTKMIRNMELYMLQVLEWDVVAKTPVHFLNHYIWIVMRRIAQTCNDACKPSPRQLPSAQNNSRTHPGPPILDFMSDDEGDDDDDDDDAEDDDIMPQVLDRSVCNCIGECFCDEFMSDASDDDDELPPRSTDAVNLPTSICERSRAAGSNDVSLVNTSDKEGDALFRVAICLLDLSLYDVQIRGRFPPHILAATALSIATEISGDTCLQSGDVSSVTDVSELGMLDCRAVLWKLFKEAQE